jgi:EpsI family protein
MNTATRFLPAAVLGLGALLVSGVREQYVVQPAQPLGSIPATMRDLPSRDLVVDKEEQRIAGMSQYVLRSYGKDSTGAFTVYVGYYDRQVQGKTIHSPKNCLPGAGWEILTSTRVPLPGSKMGGTTNRVLLANKNTRALVYYWYQGRGRQESSEYRVKWDLLRDAALYGRTEEALVRIVVPVAPTAVATTNVDADPNVVAADEVARSVATMLTPAVERIVPSLPRG